MAKGYLDMLFSRKERALDYHIRWGNFIHMCRAESCYSTQVSTTHWHFMKLLFSVFKTYRFLSINKVQFILSVKLEQRTVTSLLEDKGTI